VSKPDMFALKEVGKH